jgi:hypothetical protein
MEKSLSGAKKPIFVISQDFWRACRSRGFQLKLIVAWLDGAVAINTKRKVERIL